MIGALIGNAKVLTSNILSDYSYVTNTTNGLLARCVSGLGPAANDDNTALGTWYFNGASLPHGLCEDPSAFRMQSQATDLQNFVGVIDLWQCTASLTPAAEGVYTCVILDGFFINQTRSVGVYFSGRSESLDVYPITSLLTIFHLYTQLLQ